jgi:hypothetical protein
LDVVRVCAICAKDHARKKCPSIPWIKFVFKEVKEETKPVYLMDQCRQWQARPPSMLQDPSSLFLGSMVNNIIMETHGRENHLLTPPGSPNNILLHHGQINQLQIPPSQINQLQIPPSLTYNKQPHHAIIQIIIHILHSGLTQLPKAPIGIRTGSALWG